MIKSMQELVSDYIRINGRINELCNTRDVFLSFGRNGSDEISVMAGVNTRQTDVETVAMALCEACGYVICRRYPDWGRIDLQHSRRLGD